MPNGCGGHCLSCGKCLNLPILEHFTLPVLSNTRCGGWGVAVDIGTTTVALALVDRTVGRAVARHSFPNPQRAYGSDIIARIDAANRGGLETLRRTITEAVHAGIGALLNRDPHPTVSGCVVAGNTVMTHLLLGLSCESLGAAPFQPVHIGAGDYTYEQIFRKVDNICPIRVLPWLAAFVGGDITAGLLYVLPERAERFLFMDLGTNGELALYFCGKLLVTSTAAGPAFEGGGCGGAAAALDTLASLIEGGYIDETGSLATDAPKWFSQKEIRDLQLAKSAVRTGLELLLQTAGLGYDDLDAVYLAGGMGQAIRADSAVTAGLLPSEMRCHVRAVGNAALGGAVRLLLDDTACHDMETLAASATELKLANHPDFNRLFVEHMYFFCNK